jgi:sec-independent protein translocase protein TatC
MALLDFFNRRTPDPDGEMSFLDHLEELRWHIIRSVIALLICAIVVFSYSHWVVDVLLFGPTKPDFISARWLCTLGQKIGIRDTLCFPPIEAKFLETTMIVHHILHRRIHLGLSLYILGILAIRQTRPF